MSESGNSYSLINTDALGNLGCLLIEKISQAVGWIATHNTPNRIAIQNYIEDIQNSDLDPLIKAVKISHAKRDIKDYCNQSKIVFDAISQLNSTADPSKIDDDWLALFIDKARLVNSESLQIIWSRVLAQECNEAGCIPKRLLNILSFISPEQANAFRILCQFTIYIIDEDTPYPFMPIITSFEFDESNIYFRAGLSYFDLLELDSLGLLRYSTNYHNLQFDQFPSTPMISIGKKQYKILNPSNSSELCLGNVLLTTDGRALCSIIDRTPPEGFLEECRRFWKAQNNISIHEVCVAPTE